MHLLQLPCEIRLIIYSHLFGKQIAYIDGGRQDAGAETKMPAILPNQLKLSHPHGRSAQLLRTCKIILEEARPLLYGQTTFRTSSQAFAGRLPVRVMGEDMTLPFVRRLEWDLRCDLLKRYCPEDVCINENDVCRMESIQLSCQVENWRGSFCGDCFDRATFAEGRQQMIDFAKLLQSKMASNKRTITVVEDRRCLSKGKVVLRLIAGKVQAGPDVSEPT